MASKRREGVSWIPGKQRAARVWGGAIAIDGRREWMCKFCSESNVWTRWRCRRCYNGIPAGLRGKYRQAVAAKSGEGSTGSSTSSGEEDKKLKSQDAEIKELRAQVDRLRRQGKEAGQDESVGPVRKESGIEEDWGMDVEEEGESRKKLFEEEVSKIQSIQDKKKNMQSK